VGHRRACCYVPYTIHCGPQTQYEALICKTTKDSALCVLHSLAGRTEAPKEKVCVRIPAALPAPRVRFLFGESETAYDGLVLARALARLWAGRKPNVLQVMKKLPRW
jgi:hypothetical protein